jgi:hypothetical protein
MFSRFSATLIVLLVGISSAAWRHGWGSGADMLWADFGSTLLLNANQSSFIADAYSIISLEKCFGQGSNLTTEEAFAVTSAQLKAIDPTTKVLFYWHSVVDISGPSFPPCYAAGKLFLEHPEWWLRNDSGGPIYNGPFLLHNLTLAPVMRYMMGVPLGVLQANPDLFDGKQWQYAISSRFPRRGNFVVTSFLQACLRTARFRRHTVA